MKRSILILFLVVALLTGAVSAAYKPAVEYDSLDFDGGMISGIWLDGSTLYATDIQNKVVWCMENGEPEIFAGDRTYRDINGIVIADYFDAEADKAHFMEPWAIVPFLDGWAVSDAGANTVRYIADGKVMTACGKEKGFSDGFCTEARFNHPTGLAVNENGLVYIADTGNGAIRTLDKKGNVRTVYTGLAEPMGLCWHDGALYIAETGRSRILCLKNGALTVLAGDGGEKDEYGVYGCGFADGPAASALFEHPQGIAVDDDGVIYIADTGNGAIRRLMDGRVSTMAVSAQDDLSLASPQGILVSGNNHGRGGFSGLGALDVCNERGHVYRLELSLGLDGKAVVGVDDNLHGILRGGASLADPGQVHHGRIHERGRNHQDHNEYEHHVDVGDDVHVAHHPALLAGHASKCHV